MRWLAFALILKASLCIAAPLCPDPSLRQAKIGGDAVTGNVVLHNEPHGFALVWLYSASGIPVWIGITDKNGGFVIDKLPPADYRLEVDGWGSTSVQLDPHLDKTSNGQVRAWSLLLRDNGCVAVITGFSLNGDVWTTKAHPGVAFRGTATRPQSTDSESDRYDAKLGVGKAVLWRKSKAGLVGEKSPLHSLTLAKGRTDGRKLV